MIQSSETLGKIAPALLKVQQSLEAIAKTGNNPHFRSSFATVNDVLEAVKEPCNKNGIVILQMPAMATLFPDSDEGEESTLFVLNLTTRLQHSSGEYIESTASIPLAKSDPQGFGSALTYGRRYALQAALGLQAEDDDAESAVTHGPAPKTMFNKAAGNTPARKGGSLFPGRK